MPPHVLVVFVIHPPGHGRSVTDFWGWDAHEAQLHCPDDVSGDIGGCSARRAHKPKFYQPTQTMVTAGILPIGENSHGGAGNRTQDLVINSQRDWPLDWSHYWLFVIHKTHWNPSHFHEIVDPKLSLMKSILFSHFCTGVVAPWKAPSSAKCNVHFHVPWKLKSFTKQWRLTSL